MISMVCYQTNQKLMLLLHEIDLLLENGSHYPILRML